MTLVQQATTMMEKLPVKSQQVVVDLLKMLSGYSESAVMPEAREAGFKRTGLPFRLILTNTLTT